MTVEEMLDDLPSMRPDMEELQALFSGKDMQHHLYGVHIPAADSYPEPEPAHWHCTCSACGQVFAIFTKSQALGFLKRTAQTQRSPCRCKRQTLKTP